MLSAKGKKPRFSTTARLLKAKIEFLYSMFKFQGRSRHSVHFRSLSGDVNDDDTYLGAILHMREFCETLDTRCVQALLYV